MLRVRQARRARKARAWVDLTSLRQSQNDVMLAEVLVLISRVGATFAINEGDYMKRSFCLFETYATIVTNGELAVSARSTENVKASAAKCHDEATQSSVVTYIEANVGFEVFDEKVSAAIIAAGHRYLQLWCSFGRFCPSFASQVDRSCNDVDNCPFCYFCCCYADSCKFCGMCVCCGFVCCPKGCRVHLMGRNK